MKQIVNKIFNRTVAKRFFVVVAALLLAGLTATAVYGYQQFSSLQKNVADISAKLDEITGGQSVDENYTPGEETEPGVVEFTLDKQEVRTVDFATTYDQATQEYVYEPTELLVVTLDIVNNSAFLYDASTTRFYAATAQGTLKSDDSYSVKTEDINGSGLLTLAPQGAGEVVLYFELGADDFASLFIDDTMGYSGQTYSIEL